MLTRRRSAFIAAAALLAFSFSEIYVHGALPAPKFPAGKPQRLLARVLIKGKLPIKVNGNDVKSGGTIVTGSAIEVPDQVSAMIDFGDAGTLELMPNSKIELDYDENGNVRVKLIRGCAVVRRKTNALSGETEIYTDKVSEKTSKDRRQMGFCALPNGELTPFGAAGAAATSRGVTVAVLLGAIGAGGVLAVLAGTRGSNPSPSSP